VRVLGVDPGLTRCGIGVVDGGPGQAPRAVDVAVVRTPADADLAVRLLQIAERVEAMMDRHRPDTVPITVAWHTPSEVKAAVSGHGNADKAQVTAMITRLLKLPEAPKPADAADALALALCHLWRSPMQSRLAAAAKTGAPALSVSRGRMTR